MNYLVKGIVIAAALVIAAPVWAQTPAPGQPSRTAGMPKGHHPSASNKGRHGSHAAPSVADQLNAQELSTLQGGAAMPPPSPAGRFGQPSPTKGIPGAGQASPTTK